MVVAYGLVHGRDVLGARVFEDFFPALGPLVIIAVNGQQHVAALAIGSDAAIRISVPDARIEYSGTIEMLPGNNARMTLVQIGGADDGRTWILWRTGYD